MKPRRMMTTAVAVAVALTVSATSTVSAIADSFARDSSTGSHSRDDDSNGSTAGGSESSTGSGSGHTLAPDLCVGLSRNTVLASCPAPCLPDAACIVYDKDPADPKLTGCDYGTANRESFCTSADRKAQTCELQCFARPDNAALFGFFVNFKVDDLGEPQRRSEDASVISTPMTGYPFQSNDFVRAIGNLQLSETITDIVIDGMADRLTPDRFVDVTVDRALLASAPGVTTLTLANLPLGSDTLARILANAPPTLASLTLAHTQLTTLPATMFARLQQLETLSLSGHEISFTSSTKLELSSLKELNMDSNGIDFFDLVAPNLETLNLGANKLLCIPESVYTFQHLQSLYMVRNPVIRPLVLSEDQVAFLEGLDLLTLSLVDPPYPEIVAALPKNDRGIETDTVDIRQFLVDAAPHDLKGDLGLPVLVVTPKNAALYNSILTSRASVYDGIPPSSSSSGSGSPPPDPEPRPSIAPFLPDDLCLGFPRNTLVDNCLGGCPHNGACVVYDQTLQLSHPSGCDYDVASVDSFCTNAESAAKTCEFHCFAAFMPKSDGTQFKFLVPFETDLGDRIPRQPDRFEHTGSLIIFKTDETPFLSNRFVDAVGPLTVLTPVTNVWISGGRTEVGTRGRVADVSVSPLLLTQAPDVTTLSLMNINFRESDVAAVLESASPALKLLNLRNTLLSRVPEEAFQHTQQLEMLILAQNELESFSVQLPELKTLDLSENYLTSIELTTKSLTSLDLRGNNFARIPPTVFALPNLQTLSLADNPIAMPLVVSQSQLDFLQAIDSLQLPPSPNPPTTAPSTSPTGTSTGGGVGNGTVVVVGADGSVVVVNGTVTTVGGVSVIVVDDEATVKKYNDVLQLKQPSATPSPGSRSAGGVASTSTKGSSNQTTHGSDTATGSSPSLPGGASNVNSSSATTAPGQGSNGSGVDNSNTSKASKSQSLVSVLVLGGLGSAFFIVIVVLFMVYKRGVRRAKGSSSPGSYLAMGDDEIPDSNGSQVIAWWTDDDMLSHRLGSGDISDVRVIGGSGSGVVWLVNYRSGSQQLVSKRLIQGEGPAYDEKVIEMVAEAKLALQLHHPSVVPFVGVAWTNKTDLQVLYTYMTNGSLSSYLAQTDASTLPWMVDKLQLAIDIIEALVYTHSFNPPLLHRDLKSSNVLLDDDFKAKLGDFGCARPESDSNTMTTSEIGTGRWLAPEILLGSTSYGSSSDIYSFGVVLCELDTHQVPYATEAVKLSEATLLQRVARGELRPSVSASCPLEIKTIAEACLAFEATTRPNAMQVAYMLRSLMPQSDENATYN